MLQDQNSNIFAGKGPFSFIIGEFDNELALAEREPDRSLRDFESMLNHAYMELKAFSDFSIGENVYLACIREFFFKRS